MIKSKNKIKIILTTYGSIETLELPFKLTKDTINTTDIQVLVPMTVQRTQNSLVKVWSTTINSAGEKVVNSTPHNIAYKTNEVVKGFDYAVYEDKFPDEFSTTAGDLILTFAYMDLNEHGELVDRLPTQALNLYVSGEGYNEAGVPISNYDSTLARVNMLSELSVLKIDTSKEFPLGIVFNKEGFKSPYYQFFNSQVPLTYNVPLTANTHTVMKCRVVASDIVKDSTTPGVIGYQTEYAYFDGGICQRTNKYNISKGNEKDFVLLEPGTWEIINQEYISKINEVTKQNVKEIEKLFELTNTGLDYLGQYPSSAELPTNEELDLFVQSNFNRLSKNGDELTFVQIVEDGTDIIYVLKYSGVSLTWSKTPFPTIEFSGNKSLGLITGTIDDELGEETKIVVDIKKGKIKDIVSKNENNERESVVDHINRNTSEIASNKSSIQEFNEELQKEVLRAKEAEVVNNNAIVEEYNRASAEERLIKESLSAEIERATSKDEELNSLKLNKENVDSEFLKQVVFSTNGDTCVANMEFKNPVTNEIRPIEVTITPAASSTNTGLMTSEMVKALTKAIDDIESLKYIGRQVASFESFADAELFDFTTLENININDYFIVQHDESRTESTENGQTTRYSCVNIEEPLSLSSFRFYGVITTVNIQIATETKIGGVISTNTAGYIFVESNGAMKLVGYDAIISSINNLLQSINDETRRAQETEHNLNALIEAEIQRAQTAEQTNVAAIKNEAERAQAAEESIEQQIAGLPVPPTKTSDLINDSNFATTEQIPTDNNQLSNGAGYAKESEINTRLNKMQEDIDNKLDKDELNTINILEPGLGWEPCKCDGVTNDLSAFQKLLSRSLEEGKPLIQKKGILYLDFGASNWIINQSSVRFIMSGEAAIKLKSTSTNSLISIEGTSTAKLSSIYLVLQNITVPDGCPNRSFFQTNSYLDTNNIFEFTNIDMHVSTPDRIGTSGSTYRYWYGMFYLASIPSSTILKLKARGIHLHKSQVVTERIGYENLLIKIGSSSAYLHDEINFWEGAIIDEDLMMECCTNFATCCFYGKTGNSDDDFYKWVYSQINNKTFNFIDYPPDYLLYILPEGATLENITINITSSNGTTPPSIALLYQTSDQGIIRNINITSPGGASLISNLGFYLGGANAPESLLTKKSIIENIKITCIATVIYSNSQSPYASLVGNNGFKISTYGSNPILNFQEILVRNIRLESSGRVNLFNIDVPSGYNSISYSSINTLQYNGVGLVMENIQCILKGKPYQWNHLINAESYYSGYYLVNKLDLLIDLSGIEEIDYNFSYYLIYSNRSKRNVFKNVNIKILTNPQITYANLYILYPYSSKPTDMGGEIYENWKIQLPLDVSNITNLKLFDLPNQYELVNNIEANYSPIVVDETMDKNQVSNLIYNPDLNLDLWEEF